MLVTAPVCPGKLATLARCFRSQILTKLEGGERSKPDIEIMNANSKSQIPPPGTILYDLCVNLHNTRNAIYSNTYDLDIWKKRQLHAHLANYVRLSNYYEELDSRGVI